MSERELGAKAFWLVMLLGGVSGAGSVWSFRRLCDQGNLRNASNRLLAHLLEFQLFSSDPVLILKAQRDLLVSNARLLREVAGPTLVLLLPYAVLLISADAYFGHAPLQSGQVTVVTVQTSNVVSTGLAMEAPAGMRVETPPVKIPTIHQISWRVRALQESAGRLKIRENGRISEKTISARAGLQWLSEKRTGSAATLIHPFELPLTDSALQFIAIAYPPATIFHMHWLVWFSVGSLAGAGIFQGTGLAAP